MADRPVDVAEFCRPMVAAQGKIPPEAGLPVCPESDFGD